MKALVGPSGSGKSTLLNIAGLLEIPNAGDVFIGGVNASKISRSKRGLLRRNDIGFVFQFHRLLPEFSAMENIMIPQMLSGLDRDEAATRADQLLGMVGLQARADFRPGLLSGGEQQRVAIARSVANAPRVLLADEPTGNLDPDTAKDVFYHLSAITRATGTAALVVTHNQQLALNMDSILTIEGEKLSPLVRLNIAFLGNFLSDFSPFVKGNLCLLISSIFVCIVPTLWQSQHCESKTCRH